jgi:hypothetical protein
MTSVRQNACSVIFNIFLNKNFGDSITIDFVKSLTTIELFRLSNYNKGIFNLKVEYRFYKSACSAGGKCSCPFSERGRVRLLSVVFPSLCHSKKKKNILLLIDIYRLDINRLTIWYLSVCR